MRIINQKKKLSELVLSKKQAGKSIGFVPTMGALHAGHLSLVKTAFAQCDVVVVSIFVNPTQFDNPADLEKYPKLLKKDARLLEDTFPESIVFAPSSAEIYGEKILAKEFHFGPLETEMEGKYRSGHFDGVATVLQLLFEIVRPHKAFFGEKDFQQLQIVKKLVETTGLQIEVVGCPILREPNGLAMSSRNERLTPDQRKEASFLYKTLQQAKTDFGTKSATFIIDQVIGQFKKNVHLKLEYFEIADIETMQKATEKQEGKSYRAFVAAYLGEVRLIDNIALN